MLWGFSPIRQLHWNIWVSYGHSSGSMDIPTRACIEGSPNQWLAEEPRGDVQECGYRRPNGVCRSGMGLSSCSLTILSDCRMVVKLSSAFVLAGRRRKSEKANSMTSTPCTSRQPPEPSLASLDEY